MFTWALGTVTGVLLGLFGVQLVSSRFATAGVSPLSRPEVLRALQAARSGPPADEVAAPAPPPDTAVPPPSPPVDAAPARPSAESTSSPAPAPPASTVARPGATAGTLVDAAGPSTSSTTVPSTSTSTTTTTSKSGDPKAKPKSESTSTTTTTVRKTTTTTSSKPSGSSQSSDTRTISSVGGVVAVKYSGGKVELKWARPNAGYQVYVKSNGPDQVVVYFYKKDRASQVRAFYKGNSPSSDVTECSGTYPNIRCR